MSADPHGALDFPCPACGAEQGVECSSDCEYMQFTEPLIELTGTPVDSITRLMRAIGTLPFASLVGARGEEPPRPEEDNVEAWLARLADWMVDYQAISTAMVDDLNVQSRQRILLQLEKDVIRGFFKEAFA